jgi:hypothetical protein
MSVSRYSTMTLPIQSTPTTREEKSSARMKDDDVHKPCDRMQFIPRASSLPPFCRVKENSSENLIADAIRLLEIKDKDKEEEDIIAEDLKNAKAILNAARIDTLKFDRTDDCSNDEESLDEKLPYPRMFTSRTSSLPSNFRMPQNEQQAQQRRSSEKLLDNMDGLHQMIYASRNSFRYDKKSDDESSVESDYSSDPES